MEKNLNTNLNEITSNLNTKPNTNQICANLNTKQNENNKENDSKYIDEFKEICENMFKKFLEKNLSTIVDDIYGKFSNKINDKDNIKMKNNAEREIKNNFSAYVNNQMLKKTSDNKNLSEKGKRKRIRIRKRKYIILLI
jgi:hypothetical protein